MPETIKQTGTITVWSDPNIVIDGKTYFVPSEKRWTAKTALPGDDAEFVERKGTITALWITPRPENRPTKEETEQKLKEAGFTRDSAKDIKVETPGVKEVMTEVEQKAMIEKANAAKEQASRQSPAQPAQTPPEPHGETLGGTKKDQPVGWGIPTREKLIVYQTAYKEACETVRAHVLQLKPLMDETEFNRAMDIALARAIKDGKALIEAGGE
jgi:hypothetical protein